MTKHAICRSTKTLLYVMAPIYGLTITKEIPPKILKNNINFEEGIP